MHIVIKETDAWASKIANFKASGTKRYYDQTSPILSSISGGRAVDTETPSLFTYDSSEQHSEVQYVHTVTRTVQYETIDNVPWYKQGRARTTDKGSFRTGMQLLTDQDSNMPN
jgi:hypothetical protein